MNGDTPHGFTYYAKSADGVEVALTIPLEGLTTPKDVAEYCRQVVSEMKSAGFVRSDRLDKPAYGGGGGRPGAARPEEKAPDNIVVPAHCGEPMVYHAAYKNRNDKEIAARFTCRKGKACAEPEERNGEKWPATNWHMTVKQPGDSAPATNGNGAKPVLMNWTQFWAKATPIGVKQSDVTRIIDAMGLKKPTMTDADGERVISRFKEEQGIAV